MKGKLKSVLLLVGCTLLFLLAGFSVSNAYADKKADQDKEAWNSNSLYRKAILNSAVQCYRKGAFVKDIEKTSIIYNGYEKLLNSSTSVALPFVFSVDGIEHSITCKNLFFGTDNRSDSSNSTSVLKISGIDYDFYVSDNTELESSDVDKVMSVLAYEKKVMSEDYTASFQWTNTKGLNAVRTLKLQGTKLIQDPDPDGDNVTDYNYDPIYFKIREDTEEVWDNPVSKREVLLSDDTMVDVYVTRNCSSGLGKELIGTVRFPDIKNGKSAQLPNIWSTFKNELFKMVTTPGTHILCTLAEGEYYLNTDANNLDSSYKYSLKLSSSGDVLPAEKAFLKNITGDSIYETTSGMAQGLMFSDQEKLSYYLSAIKDHFYKGYHGNNSVIQCFEGYSLPSNYISINIDSEGNRKNGCGALKDSEFLANKKSIYGFNSSNMFDAGMQKGAMDFDAVVAEINRLSADMEIGTDIGPVTPTPAEDTEVSVKDCMNSGAAGSMAWVICPISGLLQNATEGMYENYIQPMLQIDASNLLSVDDGSTTRSAWETFRNIANTAFIIILLVIIFSQLTGVGIDNYGIKKALPKLIVAAVLINLSYIICTLCVDLSNIIGNGVKNIFDSFGASPDLNKVVSQFSAGQAASVGSAGAIVAVTIFVAVFGLFVQGLYADPSTLIPLILAAIGMLIGILFLFVMLAARQAAIVCLTVASPIIVVLYVLPNTKRFFDKVSKIFWQLLLVYPICGLLIGGGNFASRLLLVNNTNADFFSLLAACAVGIAPIFFIPQVLTSALNGLGGLGSKIQGLGNRLGSTAKNVVGNSGAAQEARKAGAERRNRFAEGRDYRRAVLRSGQWTDRDGNIHNARNSRFRPLAAAAGLRERAAGSGLGRLLGMDRAMGEAATKQAALGAERNKNRNTFDNMDNVMNYTAESNKDAENKRIGSAKEGYTALSQGSYKAMQRAENRQRDSKNRLGITVEDQANYDAKQRAANNAVLSANAEGITVESIDSLRAKQRDRNIETAAQNRLIAEEGINVRSEDARMIDKIQQVHGVKAEEAAIGETLAKARELYPDRQFSINDLAKSEAVLTSEKNNEFAKTFATNETGASEIKIDHEIGRLANAKLQADKNEEQAVPVLTTEVAEQRAKAAVIAQEYKNATDQFKNMSTTEVQNVLWDNSTGTGIFAGSMNTNAEIAQTQASIEKLVNTGSFDKLYEVSKEFNPGKSGISQEYINSIASEYLASGSTLFKGFGKMLNAGERLTIDNYINLENNNDRFKNYIASLGDNPLGTWNKDDLETLNKTLKDENINKVFSATKLKNASITAGRNDKRSCDAIKSLIERSGNQQSIGYSFSAEDLTKIPLDIAKAICGGDSAPNISYLNNAIDEIQKPGNERLLSSMPRDVRDYLRIP